MTAALFLEIIRLLPDNVSLNEAVATVLDISYDAAHRRTSGKSKLSLEEALKLSAHYGCSLDGLQAAATDYIVPVQKTAIIETALDLENYFNQSAASIEQLSAINGSRMYYSAKDIPIFHTLQGGVLTRFKIYVWLRLLSDSYKEVSFVNFNLPLSTLEAAKKLGALYQAIPKTEVWDTTTFNSTLKQIHFYFQAGLLEAETAGELCQELTKLLERIKSAATPAADDYQLYHNELLLMNNTVLIKSPYKMAFYVPFTFLSYFLATDNRTCNQADQYIQKQLKSSKLLNTAGAASRNLFFIKINKRIDALAQLVAAQEIVDFE
jgi:hypothetical protein